MKRIVTSSAIVVVLVALLSPGHSAAQVAEAPAAPSITINLKPSERDVELQRPLVNLSLEVDALTHPDFAKSNLPAYLKTLGQGTLRVGAKAADATFWTSNDEPAPDWATATITPEHLKALDKVADKSEWKIILAVNLRRFDPQRAGDEADKAKEILGDSLEAIEIGNEPELYIRDPKLYLDEYNAYEKAIHQKVPDLKVSGPGLAQNEALMNAYVDRAKQEKDVTYLNRHLYPGNACGDAETSVNQLLSQRFAEYEEQVFRSLVAQAEAVDAQPIIGEANSVFCEGQDGVSDVFASSLWALDFATRAAWSGVEQVYFHGSVSKCGDPAPVYKHYTPLCYPDDPKKLVAQPEFYGLLAASKLKDWQFIALDNSRTDLARVYAMKNGRKMQIIVIAATVPARPIPLAIDTNAKVSRAKAALLRTSSPDGLMATTDITFGDEDVDAKGKHGGVDRHNQRVDDNIVYITLPPGSAAIIDVD